VSSVPRLVATDLDGTLLRSDGTTSQRTREVLARVPHLVVVTGRPPRWMHMVAEQVGRHGEAIVANGGGLLDLESLELIATFPLQPKDSELIVERVTAVVPDAVVAGETGAEFRRERHYRSTYGDSPDTVILPRAEVYDVPLIKLLVRSAAHDADGLLDVAAAAIGDLATCTHSSRDGLLEISAAGVTKATALQELCARFDVAAEDVVAFGDMPNDAPMLRWVGRGFAVAGAHPIARAAADEVVGSNDADGVAEVLERWF
jgi:Cof subfamily protein (haloacid dehalogenase superfamily)